MRREDLPAPDRPALRRAAWGLVLIMSVLLVLAFVAVVWGFIRQGRAYMEARAARPAAPAAAEGPLVTLTLGRGVRIVSARTEAGKLVLHVTGPRGDEVQVIDLRTGALTTDVRTAP